MSNNSNMLVPKPVNEPILGYAPGSPEKTKMKEALADLSRNPVEVPIVIGGKDIFSGNTAPIKAPHDHSLNLGLLHQADKDHAKAAVDAAMRAFPAWSALPWSERASVFVKAAELLATKYRYLANASTMLGQSKTVYQAEIDSACELIDFWRFNPFFMNELYSHQPAYSPTGHWNRVEYRPLEGFILAVTPFNFTSIAGNLPTAPAMMGNCCVWKPASTSILSSYFIMRILQEAGLPDGVINMVPGPGATIADPLVDDPNLAGIHFTGSTGVFNHMWRKVGQNINHYKGYPRLVGETGGKDFIFADPSADVRSLVVAAVRGAFENQGQKCSAASRMYIPKSLWSPVKDMLVDEVKALKMGDVTNFSNFMGAVIDGKAYNSIKEYIDFAKASSEATILVGGDCDASKGWFIQPTVVLTTNPTFKLMQEEIFGPVLTVYVYDDNKQDETLDSLDTASPYALTGAIFAQDRHAIHRLSKRLTHSAGNFYVNDKPTGAVVGQQPFGGGRLSGTNDKAGSWMNLLRWVSARTIKETFVPATSVAYPFMQEP